ncbi:MAG: hypothetical protein ABSB67_17865 [Bryobacteraceae bacterium]|jgi:hypothetical protein
MRFALVLAVCACILEAQNATANRRKAADYPVSALRFRPLVDEVPAEALRNNLAQ